MLDPLLCDRIQCAGRFVEDQDCRVLEEDPGDGDSLALSAGESGPAFAHICIKTIRHLHDVFIDFCFPRSHDDFLICRVRSSVADVLADRIGKDKDFLLYDSDAAAE